MKWDEATFEKLDLSVYGSFDNPQSKQMMQRYIPPKNWRAGWLAAVERFNREQQEQAK